MAPVPADDLDRTIPVPVRRPAAAGMGSELRTPGFTPQLVRLYLLIGAGAMAVASGLLWQHRAAHPAAVPLSMAYAVLMLASVAVALAPARLRERWGLPALGVLVALSVLAAGIGARWRGYGLAAPSLILLPLLVFALAALAGWWRGLLLATWVALALVLAHSAPEPISTAVPWPLLAAAHAVALAVAVVAGGLLNHRIVKALTTAARREQRFQRLLALATDLYWEVDAELRLVAAEHDEHRFPGLGAAVAARQALADLAGLVLDDSTAARLRADLLAHRPFRDLPGAWRLPGGGLRQLVLSGEPRHDGRGGFRGFWGVARDVSAGHATRAALESSQTRYQQLFMTVPTALLLHAEGRVIDANPAAARLFGLPDTEAIRGRRMLSLFPPQQRDTLAARLAEAQRLPLGSALPPTEYRLRVDATTPPRERTVQSLGVRVELQGQPAVLSILADITDRVEIEEALRRSEAMLTHLVDTSPDLITLTDLSTGRYRMVNRAFERLSGWRADEAIGRTALELGIWGSDEARQRFVERLGRDGSVADLPVPFRVRSGLERTLLVSAARFTLDGREHLVINARDVTDKERDRLERSAILENAGIGIAVTRGQRFVLANAAFERMIGWRGGSLIGQGGRVVWASDSDYAEVGRLIGPALARGETVEFERLVRRQDGSTFLARLRAGVVDPGRPADGGTVWIIEDITERRQFEQALARARDDAEAANRAKSAFLANTSHELRTPLNGMLGLARLARDPALAEDLRTQYLAQVEDSALALAGIISDILDLSKIEAGRLIVEHAPFDLAALLESVVRAQEPAARSRGLSLELQRDPRLESHVSGDALRVRQIVTNYLVNAIKFTERGGVVIRASRPEPGAATVRVVCEDTGPGIEPAVQAELFRPFTQADQSTTRRFGGTGLGLSICRELAALMGGRVGVDSRPGEGSRFWVELPLPATNAEPLAAAAAAAAEAGTDSLAGLRVLMVEDNAVNMLIAVATLERWGVRVTQARDGSEALAAVAAAPQPFDLVLMDVQMPGMSGHEATREIRRRPGGRGVPIVALTAAALVSERDQALAAGMDDFLTKPIDAERLQAALQRWRRGRSLPAAAEDPA
jgi:PAS domain S-box-containing protein